MRLTAVFAVTGGLIAALAALPLYRLWAVSVGYGDAASEMLAVGLAIGGAVLLIGILALLHFMLMRPLAAAATALGAPPDQPHRLPPTRIQDLAALMEQIPQLRRSDAGAGALRDSLMQTHAKLETQSAALETRSRHLQLLVDAIPLPLELRGADGSVVLTNRHWRAHTPSRGASHRSAIVDSHGKVVGHLLTDLTAPHIEDEEQVTMPAPLAMPAKRGLGQETA